MATMLAYFWNGQVGSVQCTANIQYQVNFGYHLRHCSYNLGYISRNGLDVRYEG